MKTINVGDKVQVKNYLGGNYFDEGEIITIARVGASDLFEVINSVGKSGYIFRDNIKLIERQK